MRSRASMGIQRFIVLAPVHRLPRIRFAPYAVCRHHHYTRLIMRLDDGRESDNVEDMRGASGGGMPIGRGGLGIGAIVVAFAASYFFGIDPSIVLGLLRGIRL